MEPKLTPQPIPPGIIATTTIGDVRKYYGPTFAQGHADTETVGRLLTQAGAASFEDYISRFHKPRS